MRKKILTAAVAAALVLAIFASSAEAGLFRRRDGTRREPVRTLLVWLFGC